MCNPRYCRRGGPDAEKKGSLAPVEEPSYPHKRCKPRFIKKMKTEIYLYIYICMYIYCGIAKQRRRKHRKKIHNQTLSPLSTKSRQTPENKNIEIDDNERG